MDGLYSKRKICVRKAEPDEKNSNLKLIELSPNPFNMDGLPVDNKNMPARELFETLAEKNIVNDNIILMLFQQ